MVGFVPKEMFFTKGVGKHREKLTSFELALRSAGIAACNLVRVSSIFPPGCRILSRSHGAKRLELGQAVPVQRLDLQRAAEGVDAERTEGTARTTRWEDVIGSGRIVARRRASVRSEKYRPGGRDSSQPSLGLGARERQVLRREVIGEGNRRFEIGRRQDSHLLGQAAVDQVADLGRDGRVGTDQDGSRVGFAVYTTGKHLYPRPPNSKPAASQHLKVLREAGLVDVRADGNRRLYRTRREGLAQLRAFLDEFWHGRLAVLEDEIRASR